MAYRDWQDAEHRRAYAREYGRKLHAEGRSWAKRNPEKVKIKRRRRTLKQYGLTLEKWEEKFNFQSRKCAICGSSDPRGASWATDHKHGLFAPNFRGILCSKCNIAIGHFCDDPEICIKAAEYLKAHKEGK